MEIQLKTFPIRSAATICTALQANIDGNLTTVTIQMNTASLFINFDTFDYMDFGGVYTAAPVQHIGNAGAGTCAGVALRVVPPNPAKIAAVVAAAATAATIALAANQAAATAATLVATLPSVFNIQNLLPAVRTHHQNHMDFTFLVTIADMQHFATPTGGVCSCFSYLKPPMGTGVVCAPD